MEGRWGWLCFVGLRCARAWGLVGEREKGKGNWQNGNNKRKRNHTPVISDQIAFCCRDACVVVFGHMSEKRAREDDSPNSSVHDLDQDADVTGDSSSNSFPLGIRPVLGLDDDAVPVLAHKLVAEKFLRNHQ